MDDQPTWPKGERSLRDNKKSIYQLVNKYQIKIVFTLFDFITTKGVGSKFLVDYCPTFID